MAKLKEFMSARIRELRVKAGFTQFEFAELVGLSTDTISAIERKKASPSLESLTKIADTLDIPVTSLFMPETPLKGTKKSEIARLTTLLKRKKSNDIRLVYEFAKKFL